MSCTNDQPPYDIVQKVSLLHKFNFLLSHETHKYYKINSLQRGWRKIIRCGCKKKIYYSFQAQSQSFRILYDSFIRKIKKKLSLEKVLAYIIKLKVFNLLSQLTLVLTGLLFPVCHKGRGKNVDTKLQNYRSERK